MEQLADKRVRRDREAAEAFDDDQSGAEDRSDAGDYDDDDEEEDEDDEGSDDEEEEPLTEQERVEEGRRMFQIFAARMFEQRVLTAFREQVRFLPAGLSRRHAAEADTLRNVVLPNANAIAGCRREAEPAPPRDRG